MAKAKKLPSGNYRCLASKTVNGKKVNKSFTTTTKKEAEYKAFEWQTTYFNVDSSIVLRDAYNRYINSKENILSPATVKLYRSMYRTNLQGLMDLPIDKITSELVQREINIYSANHSPKSVKNNYGLLTAVINMFAPEKKLSVKLPQKAKHEIYIPTDEEVKKIIKYSNGDLHIAIMLAAFAGLRRGEICALTVDDITDNGITVNKALTVNDDGKFIKKAPKTFSGYRNVEIPKFVKTAIQVKNGKIIDISPNTLGNQFRELLSSLNMPRFRFHDLRHYYVSHLFDLGLPEKYIIGQVGHSSSNITKTVYDHLSKEKVTKYSKIISESFSDFSA